MVISGFLTIPWLGPKYSEPCAPSVPKVKVGHADNVRHGAKVKARTLRLCAPKVPKAELGHMDHVPHQSQR